MLTLTLVLSVTPAVAYLRDMYNEAKSDALHKALQ